MESVEVTEPELRHCAYCKDELLPGATVCRSCARKQPKPPLSPEDKSLLMIYALAGLVVLVVLTLGAYGMYRRIQEDEVVTQIVARAQLCGRGQIVTEDAARGEIEDLREHGATWEIAEGVALYDACGYK